MLARDCGVYANRNPAAHEVRDDEGSPMRFFFLGFLFGGQKEIRPPEAMKQIGSGKVTPPAGAPPHRRPSSGAPRQLPPGEARVLVVPAPVYRRAP